MKELSLHILDIVQNSIRAEASKIEVRINENIDNNQFFIAIEDNGKGMTEDLLSQVTNPFVTTRTTRKVGLGISLLKQNAELTGGTLKLISSPAKGTVLSVVFGHQHLDRPIMGDIAGTMTLLIAANPEIHFIYSHKTAAETFKFDTVVIKKELEEVPINHPDILKALKKLINENLKDINATIK